jgi:hypothetical protein
VFIISHIGLFYLFGKSVKIKKLWVGMIATIIPDIALIIVAFLAFTGINISFASSHPLNLYLHSFLPILLFIPFAICCREYFYSLTMGYSFHLFMDYLTHSSIRMPFYPISNWKLPIFFVSYLDINVTLTINIIISVLFIILFGKKIKLILKKIFDNYRIERVWLLHLVYVSFALLFGVSYIFLVIVIASPILLLVIPFVTINFYFIGILFILEVYYDENLRPFLGKVFVKILILSDEG